MQVSYSGNECNASYQRGTNCNSVFLKWPGGKRAILNHLLSLAPTTFRRYYEPFVGSGALFFALAPAQAILSDSNEELMNCYIQVRDCPGAVTESLNGMRNTREDYYLIRESLPTDPIERAARFIYLMTLSFNGLHRVNRQGKFNVPYNHKSHLNPCNRERIFSASLALSCASIAHCDFEQAVTLATHGDFVYFDPPYVLGAGSTKFIKYNAAPFSWKDQIRLAHIAHRLANRGCRVLISNANHHTISELYQDLGFNMYPITRLSVMAAKSKHRGSIVECLFYKKGETHGDGCETC